MRLDSTACAVTEKTGWSDVVAKKLMYVVTEDWYFCSHRLGLARAAQRAGFEVHLITQLGRAREQLAQESFTIHPIEIKRGGVNPLTEALLILKIARILRDVQPDLVHNVALKPVVYASLASRVLRRVQLVNALTGLGFIYSSSSHRARLLKPLVQLLLRQALAKRSMTIFQNVDDQRLLTMSRVVPVDSTVLIPGSGVDTNVFRPADTSRRQTPVVALPARLLREKGVYEFVAAARILKDRGIDARFVLIGDADAANRGAVASADLALWREEGAVELWGFRSEMASTLKEVDIVVLPSYRGEGVPKSLLEAASSALPIVTTQTPGCQDIVHHQVNGLLVPMGSVIPLAEAIATLIADAPLRQEMGSRGRVRVLERFSEEIIIRDTLALYQRMLGTESHDARELSVADTPTRPRSPYERRRSGEHAAS